jgi:hypothetical protein
MVEAVKHAIVLLQIAKVENIQTLSLNLVASDGY